MRLIVTALSIALLAAPLAAQDTPPSGTNNGVTMVKRSDPAMIAAVAEARRTLPDFFRHLASPAANESDFQLKFNIAAGQPQRENIWAGDLQRDANGWTGRLADDAVLVPAKAGDRVRIPEDMIADWSYMKADVMQGSFTTRVMLEKMDPARAAEFRKSVGW